MRNDDKSVMTLTFQRPLELVSTDSLPGNKMDELALLRQEREVLLNRASGLNFVRYHAMAVVVAFGLFTLIATVSAAWFIVLVFAGLFAASSHQAWKLLDDHSAAIQELNTHYIPPQLEIAASKEEEEIMDEVNRCLE